MQISQPFANQYACNDVDHLTENTHVCCSSNSLQSRVQEIGFEKLPGAGRCNLPLRDYVEFGESASIYEFPWLVRIMYKQSKKLSKKKKIRFRFSLHHINKILLNRWPTNETFPMLRYNN